MNIACALLGGPFLEASPKRTDRRDGALPGRRLKPSRKFWRVLFDEQKSMPMQQKWDLIASVNRRGKRWDRAVEPLQSHELLLTLRNELAHYKGSVASISAPPVNKLKALMTRFKGRPDPMNEVLVCCELDRRTSYQRQNSPGPGLASIVQEFEKNIHLYLFGQNSKVLRVKTPRRIRRARGHAS